MQTTDGWKDEDKDSSMLEPPSIPAYINHTVVIQDVAHRTYVSITSAATGATKLKRDCFL